MTRVLVAAAVLLTALGAVSGASAAQTNGGHHYFWIDTPPPQPDRACQARDLWSLINRGDLCQVEDAPTSPPLFTP